MIAIAKTPFIPSIGNKAELRKNIGNTIAFITVSYTTSLGRIRLITYDRSAIKKDVRNTSKVINSIPINPVATLTENKRLLTILIIPTSRNVHITASKI
ncbi:hypothetical protein SAMN02745245_01970 [Anaerosphaera aminiphila DSM 21120]|uniref:Uncharacterized protein n=1 Tax=Anaerosphaera aminiphila DSM 21120 TaxID=1120995 RepID=A0A1M5V3X4_9FIRM|nr:hypothetical protein SAMN02745245_01970 [Anaerosphaera aminiphila DSM 21120]